jgi:GINS complex subunit 4
MDIDDILADLDHEHVSQESQDLQSLTRSWVAERVAPELLPWPEELIDRVLARITKQVCHNKKYERLKVQAGTDLGIPHR